MGNDVPAWLRIGIALAGAIFIGVLATVLVSFALQPFQLVPKGIDLTSPTWIAAIALGVLSGAVAFRRLAEGSSTGAELGRMFEQASDEGGDGEGEEGRTRGDAGSDVDGVEGATARDDNAHDEPPRPPPAVS